MLQHKPKSQIPEQLYEQALANLAQLIRCCWDKQPDKRPTADHLAAELQATIQEAERLDAAAVNRVMKAIAHKSLFAVENYDMNKIHRYDTSSPNEETIKNADLSSPIILAEISPNNFNVIDGHHRVEKAFHKGHKTILAYRIMAEQHIPFLTSGYRGSNPKPSKFPFLIDVS